MQIVRFLTTWSSNDVKRARKERALTGPLQVQGVTHSDIVTHTMRVCDRTRLGEVWCTVCAADGV